MLENYIKELSAEMGLDTPLPEQSPGVFAMTLDDDIVIQISKVSDGISFTCKAVPCPKMRKGEFLSEMMLANLFGQGTLNAVLGLNESGDTIVISRIIDHKVDYKEFTDVLEDFMNVVDFWREEALAKK